MNYLIKTIIFPVVVIVFLLSFLAYIIMINSFSDEIVQNVRSTQKSIFEKMPISSVVLDRKNRPLAELSWQKHFEISIDKIPQHVIDAFLAAEDKNYFSHPGFDLVSIFRATIKNALSLKVKEGGSTITQQLARIMFLTPKRTINRKFKELVLALAIEKKLSKNEILELYLNRIYLGNGSVGIEAAALRLFRKTTSKLNIAEAALVAGLVKAPSYLAPNRHWQRAKKRQREVLSLMKKNNAISKDEFELWKNYPIEIYPTTIKKKAPYAFDAIVAFVEHQLHLEGFTNKGLKIKSSIDLELNDLSQETLFTELKKINKHINKGTIEGALVSISPKSGEILTLVGGTNYNNSQFNRALYTRRSIGNALTPLLWTVLSEESWGGSESPVSLWDYRWIVGKVGVIAISELLAKIGWKDTITHSKLITKTIKASPLELAKAYSLLFAKGIPANTELVEFVTKGNSKIYDKRDNKLDYIISEESAFLGIKYLDLLKKEAAFLAPSIKTATIWPNHHNAWMISGNEGIVTVVWIGSENGLVSIKPLQKKIAKSFEKIAEKVLSSSIYKPYLDLNEQMPKNISFKSTRFKVDGTIKKAALPFKL